MSRTSTGSSSHDDRGGVPTDARSVERVLTALGVRPARRLGQSFLIDPFVADAEASLLGATPGQPVVEVGGGLGILTDALVRRGVRPLTVLEPDPRLARFLRGRFPSPVEIGESDALTFDIPRLALVIGNLPFSVATPILISLWKHRAPRIVALVQREVAERIAAPAGGRAFGRLSILAALYGRAELYQVVASRRFRPEPEVEGRILAHAARAGPLPVPSVEGLERLVRGLFSSRRKQLGNLLPRLAPSRAAATRWARDAGWPVGWEHRRPEELPSEAYFALARTAAVDRRGPGAPS